MTSTDPQSLSHRYDRAAPRWGDKMRVLGYADAYLGFLANAPIRAEAGARVCDVGCGTGAFADAWVGIYGRGAQVSLLDPSRQMLDRAEATLKERGARPATIATDANIYMPDQPFDHILLAHVIEHVPDPAESLRRMRDWVTPGGRLWLVASKPHWCNAIIWVQWRHRAFRAPDIASLLAQTGWRLDHSHAFPSGPPSRTSRGYLATAI